MNSPSDQQRMAAPNVIKPFTEGPPTQRPLRTWYDVTFGPPELGVRPIPYYPDDGTPRFGDVFVQANQHLIAAAHAARPQQGPLSSTAADVAASGYIRPQDRQVASTPQADTPAKVLG